MHSSRFCSGLLFSALLGLGAALPVLAQGNLIQNGSFESGNFVDNGNKAESLPVGDTSISGWTVANAETAWLLNGNTYGGATPYGSYFLDLTGYHDSAPYGGVTQMVATTSGARYTLTFSLGADQGDSRYQGPVGATASAGSVSQTFTFTPGAGATGNQWGVFSLPFTATSGSTAITLIGSSAAGGQYLGLDNVSVVAAPEPASDALLALGGLGVTALTVIARRRKTA